jgi:drug/metabolite transporter (DMT)-like permease
MGMPAMRIPLRATLETLPRPVRAMGLMLFATFILSVMQAIMRHVTTEMHPFEATFFRNLFGLLALLPAVMRTGFEPLRTRRIRLHMVRGALHATSMLTFFYGLAITPLAKVAALNFSSPLFASIAAVALLRERLGLNRGLALAVGALGAAVILRPGAAIVSDGALFILIASMSWGMTLIVIKKLSRTETSLTITLYMMVFLTPISFVAAVTVWTWPTWTQLAWMVAVGMCGSAGHMSIAQALKDADTTAVMPFDFARLIWAGLLGFLVFGEIPDVWTLVGAVMIFAAAFYVAVQEGRAAQKSSRADTPAP